MNYGSPNHHDEPTEYADDDFLWYLFRLDCHFYFADKVLPMCKLKY